jgi:hypothetical protein
MTNEDLERFQRIERNIEFVAEQQARFSSDMQQVREVLHTHSEALVTVVGLVGRLGERMEQVEARMAELAAAGKDTEERLNTFISFVEKYISGRNGGQRDQ